MYLAIISGDFIMITERVSTIEEAKAKYDAYLDKSSELNAELYDDKHGAVIWSSH